MCPASRVAPAVQAMQMEVRDPLSLYKLGNVSELTVRDIPKEDRVINVS